MSETRRRSEGVRGMRVVLVGQDERFRTLARDALQEVPGVRVVGEATEATAAMLICILGDPDVVIVDALMSWHEGSAIIVRIHEARPTTSIVASRVTASDDRMVAAPLILSPGPALAAGPWSVLSTVVRGCDRSPSADRRTSERIR